ncbi:alanine racemase [Myxococcota bacterium]|nr:alanine racemase [Myxococcota bacterium]
MAGMDLTWIELSKGALEHNLGLFRESMAEGVRLLVPIKANAYGHGLAEMARVMPSCGADWLGVHSLQEAMIAQDAGATCPILVLGYVPFEGMEEVVRRGLRVMVTNWESAEALARIAEALDERVAVHLKIETGTNRQGLQGRDLLILARSIHTSKHLVLEGCYTHFANIEDTTDHSYAKMQLERFERGLEMLEKHGIRPQIRHAAASAASMLFRETHFEMIRPGISAYGLWPSRETYVSLLQEGRSSFPLRPVLSWKTVVTQVKEVVAGEYIGYGCTYRTTRGIRLAILPIGYYDGYDRGLSNVGYVLIRGQRAPVRGRICMNLTMVDVTDIGGVDLEDEVVLIGKQGEEEIKAESFASWFGTIHYEAVSRLPHHIRRRWVA